ncbi:hypothetical protein [Sphingopyxis granuli]|uniref:hypothetical protein n=1 Tax=Sphingopyxis granuli TaxID=267128 RepID=UPI001BB043D4|nr:hypothetical protein [Sphingopyxis granuli]QUM72203.1 hypothetical protein ICN83_18230 [Sphingopyxis granuli]
MIGSADAARLCDKLGGTHLYIPASPGPNHPLVIAIGPKAAQLMADRFTSETLQLPKAYHRRRLVLQLAEDPKLTLRDIALATDYSERHVIRIIAEQRDDRQGELFPDL